MGFPWIIVGGTGYDVEDVDSPQTRDLQCPSCEKLVRFVEKQMVKNLRIFGVPLVGVERGRRVFECPRCRACIEPADAGEPTASADAAVATDAQLAAATAQMDHAQFDVDVWRRRVDMAAKHRDATLGEQATEQLERARRELARLRGEFERLVSGVVPPRRAEPAATALPTRPTAPTRGEPQSEREVSTAFAALKQRLARQQQEAERAAPAEAEPATVTATAREPVAPPPDASEAAIDDEFAALKARLRRTNGASREPAADVAEPRASVPPPAVIEPVAAPQPDAGADVENEVAALKARLSGARTSEPRSDAGDYQALRRELAAPAPAPAPATPAPEVTDEDPMLALKHKLRRPGS